MKPSLLCALLLAAWSISCRADAPAAAAASKVFQAQDVFALRWASDPQMRPDGRAVAYLLQSNDIDTDEQLQSLWVMDLASGTPTPLGTKPGFYSSVRWSPAGDRLAYLFSDPDGRTRLVIRDMRTGDTHILADDGPTPHDIQWSPDGHSIAFIRRVPEAEPTLGKPLSKPPGAHWAAPLKVSNKLNFKADGQGYRERGYSHVFVISADGGSPRQLTSGSFDEAGPLSWSPDGRELLLAANRTPGWEREPVDPGGHAPMRLAIHRLTLDDGQLTPLTPLTGRHRVAGYSPDGRRIAFLGFEDRRRSLQNIELMVMDRDGKNLRSLTAKLDRSISGAHWAPDGTSLFMTYTDKGITRAARVTLEGRISPIAEGLADGANDALVLPYSGGEFSVSRNGVVAYTGGATDRLPEIFVVQGGKPRRITQASDAPAIHWGATQHLQVNSSFDRRPIDAWMVTPPGFDPKKKYPLILEIHGGPYLSYGPLLSLEHQLFAAAGYVVVYANPRGSATYGEEFANLIHDDYPSHDYDDLMSAVDAAIATGHVDSENLFVAGHSGGGVLTAWIVGKTPRFRAAASQNPMINWSSGVLTSDIAHFVTHYWFDKMPWEAPDNYWRHSPLSLVGNVTTPTLMVAGAIDVRTPPTEALQFYQALQLRGVPTALVEIPDAYHLLTRPSQFAARSNAILAWFDRYRR